jgi:hypothetical protein
MEGAPFTISLGLYGSFPSPATKFHGFGFHVIIGLDVVFANIGVIHFTKEHHVGFELHGWGIS